MTVMKHALSISAGVLTVAALAHQAVAQTVFPTGTTIYKPDEASSSYILISDHTAVGNHPSARVRAEGARSDLTPRLVPCLISVTRC